ncbi:MAG: hypothetical protein HY305_00190 [Sphingobacteriales bacterium]|nr:hypothetical protein [Sphingobacteriales bacterium]
MKQTIITLVILFISFGSFAQQTNNNAGLQEQYEYLKSKSRWARAGGFVMVAGGITSSVVGTVMIVTGIIGNPVTYDVYGDEDGGGQDKSLITTGAIVTGVGIGLGIASVPFFVKSSRLGAAAKKIKIQMRSNSVVTPVTGIKSISKTQLQLTLSIPLG